MSEIEDRRRCAREAANSVNADPYSVDRRALEAAITVATQVKITPEVIEQVRQDTDIQWLQEVEAAIRAFCDAAGFEIVE